MILSAKEASAISKKVKNRRKENAKNELKRWLDDFSDSVKNHAEQGENSIELLMPLNPLITPEVITTLLMEAGYETELSGLFIRVRW